MNIFEWEDGTVVEPPYIEIDGVKYYVHSGTVNGGVPVTSNNLNEMQYIVLNNLENMKGKILWENQNPISNMSQMDISLSSDDYDYLIWIYAYNNNIDNTNIHKSTICLKGSSVMMNIIGYVTGFTNRRQAIYVNSTTYNIRNGMDNSNNENSTVCIPLYVVGGKF